MITQKNQLQEKLDSFGSEFPIKVNISIVLGMCRAVQQKKLLSGSLSAVLPLFTFQGYSPGVRGEHEGHKFLVPACTLFSKSRADH